MPTPRRRCNRSCTRSRRPTRPRALIVVRRANPIFKVEEYQLSDAILRAAGIPGSRIALVADTSELLASYEYVELLARQKNLDAKAFRSESEALRWLLA